MSNRRSEAGAESRASRWKRMLRQGAAIALVVLAVLLIGAMLLPDPAQAQKARQWLADKQLFWLIWRFIVYSLVIFVLAPRWARQNEEDPEQSADDRPIIDLQLRLVALAAVLEILVIQHGLAWIVGLFGG